ncbi:MAG: type I-A CRISPR-associated protein Cas4/Csa1 [Candidatus Methanofastidiosia archaeon]
MYFLNDVEKKYLLNHLHKVTRKVGVTDELRGWSWYEEPLKPYYDITLPMYIICGKYCPTSRDVYLRYVQKEPGEPSPRMVLGQTIHSLVASIFNSFLDTTNLHLESEDPRLQQVSEFVEAEARAAILKQKSQQPYASERDILHTSLPFLVEHRISGELLGLSGLLSIDALDYLHGILFDLKVGKKKDFYRLYCTGYALVFESIYEVPVDVGCTVYIDFRNDRLFISKDLFHISDNLRSWWVEERDHKMELVSTSEDPGKPRTCPESCSYYNTCR